MEIQVKNRQNRHRIHLDDMERKATIVLDALGAPEAELSLLIVSDEEIADLNKMYLDRSGPTNVIAFPMRDGAFSDVNPNLLGDVVISLDTAAREARACGMTIELRLDQLLVHGILHLFGFDHENKDTEARAMRKKEEELLRLLQPDNDG